MVRAVRIAMALACAFSIAYVLITPDPTDDVTGILRPGLAKAQKLALSFAQLPAQPTVMLRLFSGLPGPAQRLTTSEIAALFCIYRC